MKRCQLIGIFLVFTGALYGLQIRPSSGTGTIEVIVKASGDTPNEGATVEVTTRPFSTYEIRKDPDGTSRVVWIEPPNSAEKTLIALTDRNGRTLFSGLAPGNYEVRASRAGYLARESDRYGGRGRLSIGQGPHPPNDQPESYPFDHVVRFRLVPEGIISGRVREANGRPMAGAQVSLLRIRYSEGRKILALAWSIRTNDLGEYRTFGLPAGEYYIGIQNVAPTLEEPPAFASRTYYPGTNDLWAATPIVLKEGQHVDGINVDIKPVSAGVTVSGTVINPLPGGVPQPDGRLLREVRMLLIPTREGVAESVWSHSIGGHSDSEMRSPFEVHNVPPGEYDVYGTFTDRTPLDGESFSLPRFYSSRTRIEVGATDLERIVLTIGKGAEIHGRFSFHGEDRLDERRMTYGSCASCAAPQQSCSSQV